MPSTDPFDRLEHAGHRAASQPVPPPPPVSHLAVEAGRRRQRRRTFAGAAVGALMVVGLPLGVAQLAGDDAPDVVTLAEEGATLDDAGGPADEPLGGEGEGDSSDPATDAPSDREHDDSSDDNDDDHDHSRVPPRLFELLDDDELDLEFRFGDLAFAIRTLTGDAAADAAEAAAAAADSTREIDGQTVWVDDQGETSVVSSLVDDGTFVEVTGPTEELEKLLDMASKAPFGEFEFFGPDEWPEDFTPPEGWEFPREFPFDRFDEDFDPETFDGFGFGGLLDEEALKKFEEQLGEFEACFEITIDEDGDSTTIEIPDCPLPSLEGLFDIEKLDPEAFGLDPERLERLERFEFDLEDLESLLDEVSA